MNLAVRLKQALRSPLLPVWLVPALLPIGRSSELGTLLCTIGAVLLLARVPRALAGHPGARLMLWLFAAYFAAALVSAFDAVAPGKTWGTVAAILRFAPLGVYICFAVRRRSRWQVLQLAMAALVAFWTLDAWVQMLTGWSLGGHAGPERITGIFGAGDMKLGPVLASLSPFVLAEAQRRWGWRGLGLAVVFVLGPILMAGSRAAWLTYALAVVMFAWRAAGSIRRFALWAVLALLVAGTGGALAWKTSPRFEARMQRTLLVFAGSEQAINTASSGRLDIWSTAWRMFKAHPINGVGVRSFRYAYPHYAPSNDHFVVSEESCGKGQGACHAHQLVLEVATGSGVLGLLMWLAGAVLALRCWRQVGPMARAQAFPATVALAVTVFPLNTHLAFYSAWWGLLFWWLLSLWCAALTVQPDEAFDA
ncbi:O-antigen ligase family protein [Oleiagrimonas sp. C23AA]|uniref:O-antigen ligase family protein n=1 Tax=Oleiagrimonas sp. C23AA TaxID=2719047 RepID=UPI00142216FF|nr:O-antigen ligase family protein [Oleiagrimonas sp. C23AA]NII12295.1 O-antigen ligase family protein [Oleiagrimonas sp. C23AA]